MLAPTIRQLTYLTALQDTGSFSIAAEHCNVTQSTLSAGIKELESILNQQLIQRGRKIARLTPFGEECAMQARKILKETNLLMARAQMLGRPMAGPMRMGIIPTIAPYMLPKILPRIADTFPALELQLHEDLSARLLEKLERGELELALIAFPYDTPGFTRRPLFKEEFLLAAPEHWLFGKGPLRSENLPADRLLLLEDGHCLRDQALEACHLQSAVSQKTFSATSLPTLLEMVRHAYGITLLPAMAAESLKGQNDIQLLSFDDPAPTREIGLIWRKNHPRESEFNKLALEMRP